MKLSFINIVASITILLSSLTGWAQANEQNLAATDSHNRTMGDIGIESLDDLLISRSENGISCERIEKKDLISGRRAPPEFRIQTVILNLSRGFFSIGNYVVPSCQDIPDIQKSRPLKGFVSENRFVDSAPGIILAQHSLHPGQPNRVILKIGTSCESYDQFHTYFVYGDRYLYARRLLFPDNLQRDCLAKNIFRLVSVGLNAEGKIDPSAGIWLGQHKGTRVSFSPIVQTAKFREGCASDFSSSGYPTLIPNSCLEKIDLSEITWDRYMPLELLISQAQLSQEHQRMQEELRQQRIDQMPCGRLNSRADDSISQANSVHRQLSSEAIRGGAGLRGFTVEPHVRNRDEIIRGMIAKGAECNAYRANYEQKIDNILRELQKHEDIGRSLHGH